MTYSETRSRLCSRIFASFRGHPESLTPVVQKHGNQKSELFCLAAIVMVGKISHEKERNKIDWPTKPLFRHRPYHLGPRSVGDPGKKAPPTDIELDDGFFVRPPSTKKSNRHRTALRNVNFHIAGHVGGGN